VGVKGAKRSFAEGRYQTEFGNEVKGVDAQKTGMTAPISVSLRLCPASNFAADFEAASLACLAVFWTRTATFRTSPTRYCSIFFGCALFAILLK